jgi:K+-sensing histidine kinase KdpD
MYVSKRSLGEGYIAGVGVVLTAVLLSQTVRIGSEAVLWTLAGTVPALALAGGAFWLQRLDLTSEQVWAVAEFSAVGLGVGTAVVVAVKLFGGGTIAETESVLYGAVLSTMAVAGAFAGVITSLHQSRQEFQRRNAVLNRVLRHNLRNDMTVVLCLLDEIDEKSEGEHEASIQQAKDKIESLVSLTDRLRQVSETRPAGPPTQRTRDMSTLVDERVDCLCESHPGLQIDTSIPDSAPARVNGNFGLVIDNIAECAITAQPGDVALEMTIDIEGSDIVLSIRDRNRAIPRADLKAVSSGAETPLEHGQGVELWLADWLVQANDGVMTVETAGDSHGITITVDAADAVLG